VVNTHLIDVLADIYQAGLTTVLVCIVALAVIRLIYFILILE